jgi:hypothetical protein
MATIDYGLYFATRSLRICFFSASPQGPGEFMQGGEVYRPVDLGFYGWLVAVGKAAKDKLSPLQKENLATLRVWALRVWSEAKVGAAEKTAPKGYLPPLTGQEFLKRQEQTSPPVEYPSEPEYVNDFQTCASEVELSLPSGQRAYIVPVKTDRFEERLEITPRAAFVMRSICDVFGPEARVTSISRDFSPALPGAQRWVIGERSKQEVLSQSVDDALDLSEQDSLLETEQVQTRREYSTNER